MVDNFQIDKFCLLHPNLSYCYLGCFASDTFPRILDNTFCIVNSETRSSHGDHWLLILNRNKKFYIYDSFNRSIKKFFPGIWTRLRTRVASSPINKQQQQQQQQHQHQQPIEELKTLFVQSPLTNNCGYFCLYVAHCIFNQPSLLKHKITEIEIVQFVSTNFGYTPLPQ